jgi:plasmid stabilization system protein ParE
MSEQTKSEPIPSEDYEQAIRDVLNSIQEMRHDGEYHEETLEGLEWRISPPQLLDN